MKIDFNAGVHGRNGHNYGVIMKEMASRAVKIIRSQMSSFTTAEKSNEHKMDDLVTSADYAAQEMIVRMIKEQFPFAGIVAEEKGFDIQPTATPNVWFTIDPLDGTKAFVRKQSDGIGCLIGMVVEGDVVGAIVADIMTEETYYFRPGSLKVHRISSTRNELLVFQQKEKLRVLLLDDPRLYSQTVQRLTDPTHGLFDSIGVSNGSVGTNLAKIYKGEVQAFITKPVFSNPWDWVPTTAIARKMGYEFYELEGNTLLPTIYEKPVDFHPQQVGEIICIHKEDLPRLKQHLQSM